MMRPTAFDLDVPVLPEEGVVAKVDLCVGPFNPAAIDYIREGMRCAHVEGAHVPWAQGPRPFFGSLSCHPFGSLS